MLPLETNLRRKKIFTAITILSIILVLLPWPVFVLGLNGVIPWFFSLLIFASLLGVRKRINNLEDLSSPDRVLHIVACAVVILYLLYVLYVVNTGGLRTGLGIYGEWGYPSENEMNSISWGTIWLTVFYSGILFMPFIFMSKLNLRSSKLGK